MTKANCLRLLEAYKKNMKIGRTSAIRTQSERNYENMKAHILKINKFSEEEKEKLFPISKPEPKPEITKSKKSK